MSTNTIITPGGAAGAATAPVDFETTKEVGYYQLVWRRFRQRRIALVAAGMLVLVAAACAIGPLLIADTHDQLQAGLGPLTSGHILGTDDNGRDLLLRNLAGGRVSLAVGALAMVLTISIAGALGVLSGFFGGVVDTLTTLTTNVFLAIPSILLIALLASITNRNVLFIIIGIALVSWPPTARIVRSVVLSVREREFVEAARAVGTSRSRIMIRHLLPNALGPIIVSASLVIGQAVILESAVSFLGLGVGSPAPTWGNLLGEGSHILNRPNGFFFALWPGLFILTVVLCFNYIGDALRDAFDPRSLER